MASEISTISYEEARQQRLLENKKRIEDLGLLKLSKSLSNSKNSEKSPHKPARLKRTNEFVIEPRRSSRARNPAPSYCDYVDFELPSLRKRSKLSSSWASYLARPVEEVKVATYEERTRAYKCAEKIQSNLQTENPSFVKSMVRSHVYSCFWLGLPTRFCEEHLPKTTTDMVLENEEGTEYDAIFISKRTGLSGGWRAFALDHKLDDGDALVFELTEPTRFKLYIVRAFDCEDQSEDLPIVEDGGDAEETPKGRSKKNDNNQTKSSIKCKKEKSLVDDGGDAEETPKGRSKKNDNNRTKSSIKCKKEKSLVEDGGDAEETPKGRSKKNDNNQTKSSTKSKKEKSPPVSGTRRSLRNKGN